MSHVGVGLGESSRGVVGYVAVGWVMQEWGWLCRGGWGYVGMGCVIQGWGGLCRDEVVIQGWSGVTSK